LEFSDPKLAINEYLGVGYYVTFPRTNYGSMKGLVWDLTKNTATCPSVFKRYAATHLPKQTYLPKFLKPKVVYI